MVGYYWLVLRNNRFHQYNRFYLLAIALFAWIVPLIKIQWNKPVETDPQLLQFFSVIADNNTEIESNLYAGWYQLGWQGLLMMIYALVAIVLLYGLIKSLFSIYQLLKTHSCKSVGEVFLILTQAKGAPFSFFRYIFWHESIDLKSEAGKQMMQHELTHVQQKHSIDKIIIQLVLIAGWFNPFFWLIKKEMEMIHEFIADKKAVANGDSATLAQMLLAAAYPQQQYLLTNPFFFSPIKRRLQMITKNTNPKFSYMRRLIVLPLLAIVVVLFAFRTKELRNAENISVGTIVDNIVDQIAAKTKPAFAPKNILLDKQYTVVINAGHGGKDGGAVGIDGITKEKNLTLALAKAVQQANQNDQIKIILTREDDVFQSVKDVADFTNQQSPHLFISLHCNTADKSLAAYKKGLEIYIGNQSKAYNYEENYLLANQMANSLSGLEIPMTGIKSRNVGISVVQNAKCPAILLETGYISNTSDLNQLKNEAYQQKLAASILNGIQYYFSSKEKGVSSDTTILNSDSVYVIPKGKNVQLISDGKETPNVIMFRNGKVVFGADKLQDTAFKSYLKINPPVIDSAQPLYVIDGTKVYRDMMKDINPNSIQSVSVLKGKSAEALYGEKGKGGVIIITSKKDFIESNQRIAKDASSKSLPIVDVDLSNINPEQTSANFKVVEGRKLNSNDGAEKPNINGVVVEGYKLNSGELTERPIKFVNGQKINVNPLIILNGKPLYADFNEIKIDPKDIESVNVLKGETATKKYGTAAEYGAIEIKTKSGKLPTPPPPPPGNFGQVKEKFPKVETIYNGSPKPGVVREGLSSAAAESYDKVFTKVEVPASFPGGKDAWQKYLQRNIQLDIPVVNGAPPGKYAVIVSFIVASDGTISNVKADNDPGYKTAEEAVRIIVKGPKWVPGKQNGKSVTSLVKQSITFVVSDLAKLDDRKYEPQ
jgi:TonB-dependent SusC/RagA subfamily outer membrane receptor